MTRIQTCIGLQQCHTGIRTAPHTLEQELCTPNTTLTERTPTLVCDCSDNIVQPAHNQNTDIGPCQRHVGVGPAHRRLQRACRGPTFRTRRCLCRLGAGPHKVSLYRRSLGLLRGVAAAGAASWASGTFAASARQRSPRCRCQSPGAPKTPAPPAARSACPGSWPRRRNRGSC